MFPRGTSQHFQRNKNRLIQKQHAITQAAPQQFNAEREREYQMKGNQIEAEMDDGSECEENPKTERVLTWLNLRVCCSPASWRLPLTKTSMPPLAPEGWQSTVEMEWWHC